MEEKKLEKYTKEYLSEFRKSISNMGTTVNNGTVIYDTSKLRREPRLNIEDILKTWGNIHGQTLKFACWGSVKRQKQAR